MTIFEGVNIVKPKRGRKSKKDIAAAAAALESLNAQPSEISMSIEEKTNDIKCIDKMNNLCSENNIIFSSEVETDTETEKDTEIAVKPGAKKRGRKPKGGKIVQQIVPLTPVKEEKLNVILHLKCSVKDLNVQNNLFSSDFESFNFSSNKNELNYDVINVNNNQTMFTKQNNFNDDTLQSLEDNTIINHECESDADKEIETKQVWKKLKQLEHNLHINNIVDKKSACFWCTYEFDNPPVYIPKHFIKDSYHVYGCFCSPECAVAHLMEENIDSSTKFERYDLLNHIYAKIYDYKKNIKPAPNVYYMLDKYYGNLSIQEYRSLLRNERFFLIVDKPLTRIMPELHEDNEHHIINNKIIPSNNFHIKKKLQRKPQSKNNILNEKFGIGQSQ